VVVIHTVSLLLILAAGSVMLAFDVELYAWTAMPVGVAAAAVGVTWWWRNRR
jgi:hypothetical protein